VDFLTQFGPLRPGGPAVARTAEFHRIKDLPRRKWEEDPDLLKATAMLRGWLLHNPAKCEVECEGCRLTDLRPCQAAALLDCRACNGGFLPLRPGAGKTAVSLLLPAVMQRGHALLVVPASLRQDTLQRTQELARHWRILPMTVMSYETLAHPKHAYDLDALKPDLIIWDEADQSGPVARKRTGRYLKAHPEVPFVAMSGTMANRAIREYDFPLRAALRGNAPIPHGLPERMAWGLALDAKVPPEARLEPGALLELPGADGPTPLAAARAGWRKRLTETPGVVSTGESVPGTRLILRTVEPPVPVQIRDAILKMRETWCTPLGDPFNLALDMWRHATSLGLGILKTWDPMPPPKWRDARRDWLHAANQKLGRSRTLDSLGHLQDSLMNGTLKDPELHSLYQRWLLVKDSFLPNSVAVWVDDSALRWAQDWLAQGPGLVWVLDTAFGERLSQLTDIPFFSEGATSPDGTPVIAYDGPSAIVSVQSCSVGKNLQKWHRNLVTNPPTTGKEWKQLLARTWREGQEADEVTVDVVLVSRESYQGLMQAFRDAQFEPEAHGLLYAERHMPTLEDLIAREDPLWDVQQGV